MGPFEKQIENSTSRRVSSTPVVESADVEKIDKLLRGSDAAKEFDKPLKALAAEQKRVIGQLDGLKRAGGGIVQIDAFVNSRSDFYKKVKAVRDLADDMLTQLKQIS